MYGNGANEAKSEDPYASGHNSPLDGEESKENNDSGGGGIEMIRQLPPAPQIDSAATPLVIPSTSTSAAAIPTSSTRSATAAHPSLPPIQLPPHAANALLAQMAAFSGFRPDMLNMDPMLAAATNGPLRHPLLGPQLHFPTTSAICVLFFLKIYFLEKNLILPSGAASTAHSVAAAASTSGSNAAPPRVRVPPPQPLPTLFDLATFQHHQQQQLAAAAVCMQYPPMPVQFVNDGVQDDPKVELEDKADWWEFHRLTNEMIITKAGR